MIHHLLELTAGVALPVEPGHHGLHALQPGRKLLQLGALGGGELVQLAGQGVPEGQQVLEQPGGEPVAGDEEEEGEEGVEDDALGRKSSALQVGQKGLQGLCLVLVHNRGKLPPALRDRVHEGSDGSPAVKNSGVPCVQAGGVREVGLLSLKGRTTHRVLWNWGGHVVARGLVGLEAGGEFWSWC